MSNNFSGTKLGNFHLISCFADIDFNASADDLKNVLSALPDVGDLQVIQNEHRCDRNGWVIDWISSGDKPLLSVCNHIHTFS